MNYIAITLGPLFKTLANVRKTRELWAASYVFSYLSKRIIEKVRELNENAILSPYYSEKVPKGVGLYPDRIFVKQLAFVTAEEIKKIGEEVLKEIAFWINKDAKDFEYLKSYFRIIVVAYSAEESENPLTIGNDLLDTLELQNKWEQKEVPNVLFHFFRKVNTLKDGETKWIKAHLEQKDAHSEVRFESLTEIATRAIQSANNGLYRRLIREYCYKESGDIDKDDNFIKELQRELNQNKTPQNEIFKNYHKYVCIVNADGDRVGAYIKSIKADYEEEINKLSKCLYDWAIESTKIVEDYLGVPIYIGGDDVLCIAPVVGKNGQTIIALCQSLNTCFVRHFGKLPTRKDEYGKDIKPTLSFGVSITYYKYPLYEALEKARNLLYRAKETRNMCSISLLKHSGNSFDIDLSNDKEKNEITKAFFEIDKYFVDNQSFLSSIMHHFRENETVYRIIGTNATKVESFLLNNFDAKVYEDYVKAIANLCFQVYTKNVEANNQTILELSEKSVHEIHSLLRMLKFLKGKEDGK